jgi:hypothetical protein
MQSPPILIKLDRALIDSDWDTALPNSSVTSLPRTTSDHFFLDDGKKVPAFTLKQGYCHTYITPNQRTKTDTTSVKDMTTVKIITSSNHEKLLLGSSKPITEPPPISREDLHHCRLQGPAGIHYFFGFLLMPL